MLQLTAEWRQTHVMSAAVRQGRPAAEESFRVLGPPSGETHMAVAKKAKKDGVEVKIETSNDAQKDKKHSKRKNKDSDPRDFRSYAFYRIRRNLKKTSKEGRKRQKKVKGEKNA